MSEPRAWWRDAVVYQVYLRSFADADGDGHGDLDGLRARLPYLTALGVDALWLNPCYRSPNVDGGYDVADYHAIDEQMGGLDALDRLLTDARACGLRVLLDIIPNHLSTAHPWFAQALVDGPGSEARARFHFRDGRRPGGAHPPTAWTSIFGGPAWTRVTEPGGEPGQWYLHTFDGAQADLNWADPTVATYFEDVLRFWFDRGIDGFRVDHAHGLLKRADDGPGPPTAAPDPASARHAVYRAWRRVAGEYAPQRELAFVGEAWLPDIRETVAFARPDELHSVFGFGLLEAHFDAEEFRSEVSAGLIVLEATAGPSECGVLAWALNNHDVHRSVSRYGLTKADEPVVSSDPAALRVRRRGAVDVELGKARARAALLFQLLLPGSIYLYQGEELGLPEVLDLPDAARRDPIWNRSGGLEHGRDGCRVPLPWAVTGPSLGFGPPGGETAWLPQPHEFAGYAVAAQANDDRSTLTFYRRALALRRELLPLPVELSWITISDRDDVLAYRRGDVIVITVFGDMPFTVDPKLGGLLLSTELAGTDAIVGPGAAWLAAAPTGSEDT